MVKANDVVYKYYEVGFAVKHKKDGFKASSTGVLMATYFKTEKAPLCRFKPFKITMSRGYGISPNLAEYLHKVRRVGTLSAVSLQIPR